MKKLMLFVLLAGIFASGISQNYEIKSPDGVLSASIQVDKKDGVFARVFHESSLLFTAGPLLMDVKDHGVLGQKPRVRKTHRAYVDEKIVPAVREKRAEVNNNYNQLTLIFRDNFRLEFRAYDDGFAYRFLTEMPGNITVNSENVHFNFSDDPTVYFPTEESFFTHQERSYEHLRISEIPEDKFASMPALVDREDGIRILITESHLEDYPGLYLKGVGSGNADLTGIFPNFVLEEKLIGDRNVRPEKRADYLAVTNGTRVFPWRVAAIEQGDAGLLDNDIVLRLAPECRIEDPSWIKPGMVAWDWWNANNNFGVDFRSGVNTETYKYYIDFAASYGLEYIILDEGWSVPAELFQINPDCNMEEITSYARQKNVGIILWVLWNALDKDLDKALDQFAEWGVKGIKVDFMQRDDQAMVNYYWKVAKAAAQRQMLVDFHGSYKPSGIRGAYPNCINREGVKGLENAKWSKIITPDHDCTIPFIRMVAGPMDYTPGAMRNAQDKNFSISFTRPMSQGTRCHQFALYVIFDSPLQMLCDAPSHYYREPMAMEFLSRVPTVWDETVPLFGKIGDYIGMARRSGDDWYIGLITDWTPRDFDVPLDFLGDGQYELIEFIDGPNADQYAEDFQKRVGQVTSSSLLNTKLAPGGGYVAVISKK